MTNKHLGESAKGLPASDARQTMVVDGTPATGHEPKISETYLSEREAAEHFGVSVRWMQRSREKGTGPKYCRLGGLVRYRRSWLDAYAEENAAASIAEHRERVTAASD